MTAAGGAIGSVGGFVVGGGASVVCDAGTMGACAIANPAMIAGATVAGGASGAVAGKALCEAASAAADGIADLWDWVFSESNSDADSKSKEGVQGNTSEGTAPNNPCKELKEQKEKACKGQGNPQVGNSNRTENPGTLLKKVLGGNKGSIKRFVKIPCSEYIRAIAESSKCLNLRQEITKLTKAGKCPSSPTDPDGIKHAEQEIGTMNRLTHLKELLKLCENI